MCYFFGLDARTAGIDERADRGIMEYGIELEQPTLKTRRVAGGLKYTPVSDAIVCRLWERVYQRGRNRLAREHSPAGEL